VRNRYRWGIVGPGRIAAEFAEGMRLVEGGEIGAVASRSAARAKAFADRFEVRSCYGNYADLAADPDIEIVYVATPHARHAADTVALLEAGKHVLCEKPLALNATEARHMAAVARANGRFLMEAMWSRFLPAYRILASVLASGAIGEPLTVEADFGFRAPLIPHHRLFDLRLGGGALLDVGIYPVQLCSLVLGVPDRVAAVAVIGTTGVDEQVAAVLHYAAGRIGVIKAAIRVATACSARISGSEGWIELPPSMHSPDSIVVGSATGEERLDAAYDGEGLRFQVDEVHRCLDAGLLESPTMSLDETISIAETLDAIRVQVGVVYPGE
jgi:predicted dehydrogenase